MPAISFDIFCRVIDNFGDIGVCWRLARQLAADTATSTIRLWVDDLDCFSRIEPQLDAILDEQFTQGVTIRRWCVDTAMPIPHDVVIEAFGCDPPQAFIQQMIKLDSLWVNLEYLSAEDWVAGCHALPSRQSNGLRKAFFFPGFTERTGGLLREAGLIEQRDAWRASTEARAALLNGLNLPCRDISRLLQQDARQILLFCYPDAPVSGLIDALNGQAADSIILVPNGVCPNLKRGVQGNVVIHDIPFVNQSDFDRLLWSSDLNCVRGEDSLVRALWAGRPLLWHIYPQDDDAHLVKLASWLARSPLAPLPCEAIRCWNNTNSDKFARAMTEALAPPHHQAWREASAQWSTQLAASSDLVTRLIAFCSQAKINQKR